MCMEREGLGRLTKDHVVLRMQIEWLPPEFGSRHQLPFAPDLQIRIPARHADKKAKMSALLVRRLLLQTFVINSITIR